MEKTIPGFGENEVQAEGLLLSLVNNKIIYIINMKTQFKNFNYILCAFLLMVCSCDNNNDVQKEAANTDIETLEFEVEEAPEWTALFNRTSGWFGADGIFAIPLDGKESIAAEPTTETMFIFSDTMIGEISDGEMQSGSVMVNNTVAYLNGREPKEDAISFHWAEDEEGRPLSLFTPETSSAEEGDYYWLGDGFVNAALDSTIYIFAYRMRNMDPEEDWSFTEMGTNLIALSSGSRPPFEEQRQIETPLRTDSGGFGAGIFDNTVGSGAPNPDGYIYVYGVRGQDKNLMVARVQPKDFETFNTWRFWDGGEWIKDIDQAAHVAPNVSNELSVSPLPDGRYALVFTLNGLGPIVGIRLGTTPYGPFGPMIEVYEAEEMQQENYFTYNAKAHLHLSDPGELLISYNVNAFDFFNEINANPNLYRPRFVKLKLR